MLDRIWSHPKASPEDNEESRFLVRQCRRDESWVVVAKEATRILEGEIEAQEQRNRSFAEAKRRIVAADPMALAFPQMMILPDAEPVARRIMLEEIREGLAQDDQPGGIRMKRPNIWKLWEDGMQHWVGEVAGTTATVATREEAMRLIQEAGDSRDLAVPRRNVVDLMNGRFTPEQSREMVP